MTLYSANSDRNDRRNWSDKSEGSHSCKNSDSSAWSDPQTKIVTKERQILTKHILCWNSNYDKTQIVTKDGTKHQLG